MLFPASEISALRAISTDDGQLVIESAVDPVDLARAGSPLVRRTQLFCHPDGTVVAGLGAAWSASGSGPDRFVALQRQLTGADLPAAGPIFAGFSFQADGPRNSEWTGFNGADAVVPAISLSSHGATGRLVVTPTVGLPAEELIDLLAGFDKRPPAAPFDPGDHALAAHPPSAQWRTEVQEAVGAIEQGDISKVVLSRRVEVTTEIAPSAFELVDHLREAYPQCHVFVWQVGDAAFIGATPELLLSKANGAVRVNPLAGTARRGEGDADDRAVGEALMHSAKDRHEHALVVDDIAARLEPLVESLHIPAQPSLRRMATVQHLSTEIVGTVDSAMHPLQLVDALHPTPAVGGTPRAAALAFLDKIEGIDRGWYTGGIGWLTSDGAATFAIPLRCALINGRTSHLYAGAGIVAESRPEAELEETRLKFRPMLSVLTAS